MSSGILSCRRVVLESLDVNMTAGNGRHFRAINSTMALWAPNSIRTALYANRFRARSSLPTAAKQEDAKICRPRCAIATSSINWTSHRVDSVDLERNESGPDAEVDIAARSGWMWASWVDWIQRIEIVLVSNCLYIFVDSAWRSHPIRSLAKNVASERTENNNSTLY